MIDDAGNGRMCYMGSNHENIGVKLDTTNTWTTGNITFQAGTGVTAVAGSPLIAFGPVAGNAVHVLYIDSNGDINDLIRTISAPTGTWSNKDLTSQTGALKAVSGSALASMIDDAGNGRVFYMGSNHEILGLKLDTTNTWTTGNITFQAGTGVTAVPGSVLNTFGPAGGNAVHVLYLDSNQHINDLIRTISAPTGTWSNTVPR